MKFQMALVTAPATSPISVTEAKEYLRVDNNLEDTRIQMMIDAATMRLENETGLKFIEQVWDLFCDHFPYANNSAWWDGVRETSIKEVLGQGKNITLPIGKCTQLMQFNTYADDGIAIDAGVSNYVFDSVGNRGRVGLKLGGVWPATVLRPNNGIQFRVKVGFGTSSANIPADLKMAVSELVAHMYENRGDQNEMSIPPHILTIIAPYRRFKLENC